MRELLNGKFAPLTYSIGFLEVHPELAFEAYRWWTTRNFKGVDYARTPIETLGDALSRLEPLCTPPRRQLLLCTTSGWLAYFDNGRQGPDPRTPVGYLSRLLHGRGVIATSVPHTLESDTGTAKGTYGAVSFELFGPKDTDFLNYERTIVAAYDGDGRWVFEQFGAVLPFEDPSQYQKRRIRDRFTTDMLQTYCEALGIRLLDEDFYCGPGLLAIMHDPLPPGAGELSLREARHEIGLD